MLKLFTRQFWATAAEHALVAAAGAFLGVWGVSGSLNLHDLEAAAAAAATGAVYSFVKSVSGVQTFNFIAAVSKPKS